MEKYIIDNFSNIAKTDINLVIVNNISALIISFFILLVYRLTYSGVAYNKRFNVSLGMITIITTLIMNVISNNIALSLGMVGALSIIRFRTAVKDVRDAAYIFWCIAVGICCGVSQYIPAAIGSVTIAIYLLIMRQTSKVNQYLIIIRSTSDSQNKVEAIVEQYFSNRVHLRVRNKTTDNGELIYEVSANEIKKSFNRTKSTINDKLIKIQGVISVEQIEHTDDLTN